MRNAYSNQDIEHQERSIARSWLGKFVKRPEHTRMKSVMGGGIKTLGYPIIHFNAYACLLPLALMLEIDALQKPHDN